MQLCVVVLAKRTVHVPPHYMILFDVINNYIPQFQKAEVKVLTAKKCEYKEPAYKDSWPQPEKIDHCQRIISVQEISKQIALCSQIRIWQLWKYQVNNNMICFGSYSNRKGLRSVPCAQLEERDEDWARTRKEFSFPYEATKDTATLQPGAFFSIRVPQHALAVHKLAH